MNQHDRKLQRKLERNLEGNLEKYQDEENFYWQQLRSGIWTV